MVSQAAEAEMKVYQAVAKYLESVGVRHVFLVNGGANLWLIKGLCEDSKIQVIPTTHEQNAGFAADAYARITGLGVAMATSGPGATNLVTAISAAYQDSVPTLYITGNCATFRRGSTFGVRNYGFQELDFVSMINGVTKAAYACTRPDKVIWCLEKAVAHAQHDRKGPAVVDIPDDIQRMELDG